MRENNKGTGESSVREAALWEPLMGTVLSSLWQGTGLNWGPSLVSPDTDQTEAPAGEPSGGAHTTFLSQVISTSLPSSPAGCPGFRMRGQQQTPISVGIKEDMP